MRQAQVSFHAVDLSSVVLGCHGRLQRRETKQRTKAYGTVICLFLHLIILGGI